MKLRILFGNTSHGMIYGGIDQHGEDLYSKYAPSKYIEFYKSINPDVLCLAECPFDNENAEGEFVNNIKSELSLPHSFSFANEKSWIVEGKFYGLSILSKFAFTQTEVFNLPNPKFEIDKPDGSHWTMHDKAAQKVSMEIEGNVLNVFNLHYFPVHRFNHKLDEPELAPYRKALSEILRPKDDSAVVITGDFNNKAIEIETAFPEIFEDSKIQRAITFDRREYEPFYKGNGIQIDHLLCSNDVNVLKTEVIYNYSDHCFLYAEVDIS